MNLMDDYKGFGAAYMTDFGSNTAQRPQQQIANMNSKTTCLKDYWVLNYAYCSSETSGNQYVAGDTETHDVGVGTPMCLNLD